MYCALYNSTKEGWKVLCFSGLSLIFAKTGWFYTRQAMWVPGTYLFATSVMCQRSSERQANFKEKEHTTKNQWILRVCYWVVTRIYFHESFLRGYLKFRNKRKERNPNHWSLAVWTVVLLLELHQHEMWVSKLGLMSYVPWSKVAILGMVIPPLIGNPYNGYINPYYWVDDHPLLYGNNVSLDPSTYDLSWKTKPSRGTSESSLRTSFTIIEECFPSPSPQTNSRQTNF